MGGGQAAALKVALGERDKRIATLEQQFDATRAAADKDLRAKDALLQRAEGELLVVAKVSAATPPVTRMRGDKE